MKSDFAFKETRLYGWENEPAQERPTDFGHSTQWSSEWTPFPGEAGAPVPAPGRRQRAARASMRLGVIAWSFGSVVAGGVVGMFVLMRWLHV